MGDKDDSWICPRCGYRNSSENDTCKGHEMSEYCLHPKPNNIKKIETPELDKMVEIRDESQTISSFLEWLCEKEVVLAKWYEEEFELELGHITETKEQLLANYFGIDLVKAEKERQAILDNIRETG